MTHPLTQPAQVAVPDRARTTLLTLAVPLALACATVAVPWSWRDELPDPIAMHWGTSGADGFGSLTPNIVIPATFIAVVALFLWALGFFWGRQALTRRASAAVSIWFAVLLTTLIVGGLNLQRGLEDARDTGSLNGTLLLSFGLATVGAVGAALLMPGDPPQPTSTPVSPTASRLALKPGEQASWVRAVATRGYLALAVSVTVFAVVMGVLTRAWIFGTVLGIVLGTAMVSFMRWTVTVDREGLTVRPIVRRPSVRIPLNEIESTEVVTVRPIREFGGYGIRGGKGGRIGVIVRKGEALQVRRTGDRVFLVTVDDAETGAALLNTLAARSRG